MEALFSKMESRDALTRMVEAMAERLRISELAGPRDTLTFERLWQIKAAAADRERRVEPVLCRIVGAYRHMVGQLPVLGPASVAIKMAGGGQLDHFSVEVRETMGEGMEWAPIVAPADAARHALGQLISLMGKSSTPVEQMSIEPSMRFGYVALGKRSGQRMLAPHYIATFQIQGEEAQAYQLLVPGTEKTYMPLCLAGRHPAPTPLRRAG
jgi:hypothetical protein